MQRRALVVDDDPAACELMQSVVGSTGMTVLALTASAQAPAYFRDEKFAVALLDLNMPAPDGHELARQMRSSGINRMTPIILVSDDQSPAAVSQSFAAGASFFLYKPIDRERLHRLIRATYGSIEQERRRFRRVALQAKVQLGVDGEQLEGETIDVSLNGMLVRVPGTIRAGSSVHVNLFLSPEMQPIVGAGSVMRTPGENRLGIQLDQLSIAESGRLQEFLLPLILQKGAEGAESAKRLNTEDTEFAPRAQRRISD
jgi:CheY-like chemotaxis protein